MGRYTYFENGKWRIKVGDTEFAGPWVDKLSYYEELAPNLENTKDEAYNLGYQTCLHAKGLTWSEARELQAYRATGLTVERAAELGKADREGRVIILQYSVKPLVWGDDAHETVLCPTCGRDLMGEFDDESAGHPIMYQCCYCGESVDSKTIISREEAEKALEAERDG